MSLERFVIHRPTVFESPLKKRGARRYGKISQIEHSAIRLVFGRVEAKICSFLVFIGVIVYRLKTSDFRPVETPNSWHLNKGRILI